MSDETPVFKEWAIVELMGHRRIAGLVSEQNLAGAALLRIDVPGPDGDGFAATQLYGGHAIYCITPVTEDMARAVAARNQPTPVQRWELAAPLAEKIRDDDSFTPAYDEDNEPEEVLF